ncbi:MAG TPA: DUF58 domain-containing protein [Thioalkalivibrio sp.]|nr:DUF58 domain-containing protein [Thioalkalivibrio sp.]
MPVRPPIHDRLRGWLRAGFEHLAGRPPADELDDGVHLPLALLLAQRERARALVLAQRRQSWQGLSGLYRSGFRGRGLDFDEMRDYQPGDDIRHIDWPATARSGRAQTRLYREERERPVLLVVDLRRAMHFGTRHAFKSVQAGKLATLIAWAALELGDRVGGLVFNDARYRLVRPQAGRAGVLALLNALAELQAAEPDAAPETPITLALVLKRLKGLATAGGLVHVASDFAGLDAASRREFAELARRHDLTGTFLYDPLEVALPEAGRLPISDGERFATLDAAHAATRHAHQAAFARHNQAVVQLFLEHRAYLLRLATHNQPEASLRRLLDLRRPGRTAA